MHYINTRFTYLLTYLLTYHMEAGHEARNIYISVEASKQIINE